MKFLQRGLLALVLGFAVVLSVAPAFAVVTYATALKNTRLDAITTAIGTSGKMKLICADGTTIGATLALSSTAAPAASGGVLTFNSITATTASATCTITTMKLTTSADVDVITGFTVGTSGSNLNMNSNVISTGQNVSVSAWTITHP